jgi:hypothetical protein
MESYEKRLRRLSTGPPDEIILTILNSIDNFLLSELADAAKYGLYDLVILGVHGVIMTITEHIFLKSGKNGFKFYLENFVDKDEAGWDFSHVAPRIYDLRNVIAHQCLSKLGHVVGYDDQQDVGYRHEDNILWLNVPGYFEQFRAGFRGNQSTKHWLYDYRDLLDEATMETVKSEYLKSFQTR